MAEVVWSDTALAQVDAIGTNIEPFNPNAAVEVAAALIAAGNSSKPSRTVSGPYWEQRCATWS